MQRAGNELGQRPGSAAAPPDVERAATATRGGGGAGTALRRLLELACTPPRVPHARAELRGVDLGCLHARAGRVCCLICVPAAAAGREARCICAGPGGASTLTAPDVRAAGGSNEFMKRSDDVSGADRRWGCGAALSYRQGVMLAVPLPTHHATHVTESCCQIWPGSQSPGVRCRRPRRRARRAERRRKQRAKNWAFS